MNWLFSPTNSSQPSYESIDDSNTKIQSTSEHDKKYKKFQNLRTFLPIAILVLACIGFAAYNWDFNVRKHIDSSGLKHNNLKNSDNIGDKIPYEDTKPSDAFMPLMYELDLKFLLKEKQSVSMFEEYAFQDTFHGKVEIHMLCIEQSSTIELNAKDLSIDIDTIEVVSREGPVLNSCSSSEVISHKTPSFVEDTKTEKWNFTFDSTFHPNDHIVMTFDYHGQVASNRMNGVYNTIYKGKDGKQRSTVATQFESQNARKMVPCFDVPDKKATWKIKVSCPSDFAVLSNTPVEKITNGSDGLKTIEFEETPRMSSYLVAAVIGQLNSIHNDTKRGIKVGIHGNAPGDKQQMRYALDVAVQSLEFMEKYTNIKYPLRKLDMVGLTDFESGAMENWGLLTYKVSVLFYDSRFSPWVSKVETSTIICHEIAHQWFGNLVTLKDWQFTWLNEGFASLFESIIKSSIQQEYGTLEEDLIQTMEQAMKLDSLSISHPLTYSITYPDEIDFNFDSISYQKGASILWMVRQLITSKAFDQAIQDYLQRNKYENTVPQDVFDSFNRYVPDDVLGPDGKKFNVELFMRQYTEQSGFPLVTVTRLNPTQLRLTQTRYRSNPDFKDLEKYANPEFGYKWDVPIWYHNGKGLKFVWLRRNEDLLIESESPIILNAEGTMYYKFAYAKEEFERMISNVSFLDQFPEENVYRLFKNIFNPSLLHLYTPEKLMEFAKNLFKTHSRYAEDVRQDWNDLLKSSNSPEIRNLAKNVYSVLAPSDDNKNNKKFFSAQIYASVVSERFYKISESYSVEKFEKVLNEVEECGDSCLQEIASKFKGNYSCNQTSVRTSECSTIKPEQRGLFYCRLMITDPKSYEMLLNFYKNEIVEREKQHLLKGLLCTDDREQLKIWLSKAADSNGTEEVYVRIQELSRIYGFIAHNDVGKTMILDYFIENWKKIHERLKNYPSVFKKLIQNVVGVIYNDEDHTKFTKFMEKNPETQSMMIFLKSKELVDTSVKWNNLHKDNLIKLFS